MNNRDNFEKQFLGKGLAFPLQVNARGELAMVSGAQDIEQALHIILGTMPGERMMRPEFGCRVHELVFHPRNATTEGLIDYYVRQALGRWEPRINVEDVKVSYHDGFDGKVMVEVEYEVKTTHDQRSIIYPFFVSEE